MTGKIWNDRRYINITDERYLKYNFINILNKSGFSILNISEHQFDNFGYTLLVLLGESHFALHTFPEANKTYIELSSCNKKLFRKYMKLLKTIV